MKRFFGIVLLLCGLFAALGGLGVASEQHRANTVYVATPAWIDRADVVAHRGSKGSVSYEPTAAYHYSVNGAVHHSTRVLAVGDQGQRSWAYGIITPLKKMVSLVELPDQAPPAVAYVDPNNPDEAVLVRAYSFTPYAVMLISLLVAALGLGMATRFIGIAPAVMRAVAVDETDARLLLPTRSLRGRFKSALAMLITACVIAAPPLYHWVKVAGQFAQSSGAWTAYVITAVTLGILLTMTLRRWALARHISDARIRVRPCPLERGVPFEVEMEADAFSTLRVTEVRCRVICTEHYREKRGNKTQVGSRTKVQQVARLTGPVQVPAGEVVTGKASVTFEPDAPPTSASTKVYPHFTWKVRIEIELEKMVDYAGEFPLEVSL